MVKLKYHPDERTNEMLSTSVGMNVAGEMAAIESVSKQKNIEESKLKTFFSRIIRPNSNIVNFHLGNEFNKKNTIIEMKKYLLEGFVTQKMDPTIQDIGVPETEDIDYSIVKQQRSAKYGEIVNLYKDGILIVTDVNPKGSFYFTMYGPAEKDKHTNILNPLLNFEDTTYYLNEHISKNLYKHKDKFTVYIVFTKAHKNKAYKFNFIDHEFSSKNIEYSSKQIDNELDVSGKIYRHLPKESYHEIAFMNGVLDLASQGVEEDEDEEFNNLVDASESEKERYKKALQEKSKSISNKTLLTAGYIMQFYGKVVNLINCLQIIKEEDKEIDEKDFIGIFRDCSNEKEFIEKLFDHLRELSEERASILKVMKEIKKAIHQHRLEDPSRLERINKREVTELMFEVFFMYLYTKQGTSLPGKGDIDTKNSTQIDCLYYWKHIDFFSLFYGLIDYRDFPLFLEEGEIFNKRNMANHVHEFRMANKNCFSKVYECYKELSDESREQCSLILNEAMTQTTGLMVPYNACVELKNDSVFRYARFVETDKFIHIFLHDENDRYMSELFCKEESEFRYWLVNRRQIFDKPENLKNMFDRLYVKLASCIRDFKVLIERNRTMSVRNQPMTPRGVKSGRKRWIYLPMVKYIDDPDQEQKVRRRNFFKESRKFSGERRAHVRRLPKGMKPSKTQLIIAENNGVFIPENHTFVKESTWGQKQMTDRQIKYRHRPLTNGILYIPDDEFKKHEDIAEMCPAKFEEHCEKYIESLGYQVYKKWNYDGGIDIRAIKDIKGDRVERLFVQCKHPIESGNPIGPDVVRELQGSTDLEMKDLEDCDIQKMVITSTRYTYKAVEAAEKLGIKLKTTDDMKG